MSWNLTLSNQAREDLDYFRAHEPDVYRWCYTLARIVESTPFDGAGRPRSIEAIGTGVWARNVTLEHRMVYEVFSDAIIVASFRTHVD